mmetsp:Transcript_23529/g.79773  ORF Transcript_23529/g.79773 Transcript_23529/m.79773 type:complete len:140 (-) Transcript_23529:247-666(-)|eukprot:CAMPEP_0203950090 /NCGR_PEP_ID=MMETSP0359-20131031/84329_1 /ASSEMBLY_ACC=CAM_ASM_000338 /TAXON_ID=268821 /ORGANISM="Scrippsiella Hangoei, Strain SHTV-5" /LENGTH=139 /DNA_ID=CAMNT_0050882207 /DNA_START=134 /DNA_END=553 /DNA_ORIENTATION=-
MAALSLQSAYCFLFLFGCSLADAAVTIKAGAGLAFADPFQASQRLRGAVAAASADYEAFADALMLDVAEEEEAFAEQVFEMKVNARAEAMKANDTRRGGVVRTAPSLSSLVQVSVEPDGHILASLIRGDLAPPSSVVWQ